MHYELLWLLLWPLSGLAAMAFCCYKMRCKFGMLEFYLGFICGLVGVVVTLLYWATGFFKEWDVEERVNKVNDEYNRELKENHDRWYREFKCMMDLHQESTDRHMERFANAKNSEEAANVLSDLDKSHEVIAEVLNKYTFSVEWSHYDQVFLFKCDQYPDLSAFGDTLSTAVKEGAIAFELFDEHFKKLEPK